MKVNSTNQTVAIENTNFAGNREIQPKVDLNQPIEDKLELSQKQPAKPQKVSFTAQIGKLISKIKSGSIAIRNNEAIRVLEHAGFKQTGGHGSHLKFAKDGQDTVVLVANRERLKPYQVKNVQQAIKSAGY